jgi:porphobilinogen synthase
MQMPFPQTRLRRLRATRALRGLVRETNLAPSDFVYPMFVAHGIDRREPIEAMPGVDRLSIAHAVAEAGEASELGIPAVLLFPGRVDRRRSSLTRGIVPTRDQGDQRRRIDLLVIADLCLCIPATATVGRGGIR